MKTLTQSISERLVINKKFTTAKIQVKNCEELNQIVEKRAKANTPENTYLDLTDIDVSKLESLGYALTLPSVHTEKIDVTGWDVSHIIYLNDVFGIENVNEIIGLETWDISSCQTLEGMFSGMKNLNNLDGIKNWNTSNVINMNDMFYGCEAIEKIDISGWNVKKLRDCGRMFRRCKNLKSVGDLSNWNVESLKDMTSMFSGCEHLEFIGDIDKWAGTPNISFVKSNHAFLGCPRKFKRPKYFS